MRATPPPPPSLVCVYDMSRNWRNSVWLGPCNVCGVGTFLSIYEPIPPTLSPRESVADDAVSSSSPEKNDAAWEAGERVKSSCMSL